jgi:hypothetical protein
MIIAIEAENGNIYSAPVTNAVIKNIQINGTVVQINLMTVFGKSKNSVFNFDCGQPFGLIAIVGRTIDLGSVAKTIQILKQYL